MLLLPYLYPELEYLNGYFKNFRFDEVSEIRDEEQTALERLSYQQHSNGQSTHTFIHPVYIHICLKVLCEAFVCLSFHLF